MNIYQHRRNPFEAMRIPHAGDLPKALVDWLNTQHVDITVYERGMDNDLLLKTKLGMHLVAKRGNWLIKFPGCSLAQCDHAEFSQRYEPATQVPELHETYQVIRAIHES
jgi:hypothetical protein